MKNDIVVKAVNLNKVYKIYDQNKHRVKEAFHPLRKVYHRPFHALKNISFELKKGESLGIIGRNGSGKSTLLQILCGVSQPTSGSFEVKGRIAALLELGAGFNPEFSGRENVYLNGSILGFSRDEMDERFDKIAEFAEIGDFIEQPVKLYSSGMYVRLAFAVQACVEPDILIIDEALAVGDIFFVQKCHERMEALQAKGTTIILVSHGMGAIEKYSTTAMLLHQGNCLFIGHPNEAVQRYYGLEQGCSSTILNNDTDANHNPALSCDKVMNNHVFEWPDENSFLDISNAVEIGNTDVVHCTKIAICDAEGKACTNFYVGEIVHFYFEIEMLKDINSPIFGVEIYNRMNIVVAAKASIHDVIIDVPKVMPKGCRLRCHQTLELLVYPDEYTITIPIASINAEEYSYIDKMTQGEIESKLEMTYRIRQFGVINVKGKSWIIKEIPFLGLVNLNSECEISVFENKERFYSNDNKKKGSTYTSV